jgi:glucose/arabinose dehydrogenase
MLGMRAWPAIATAVLLLAAAPAHAAPALEAVGSFTAPIEVTSPPGDASRLFVVERGGTVRVVRDGVTLAAPFLTIPASQLTTDGERGLLSMTFAPDYASSGRLYTFSIDAGGDIRVDLWMRSPDPDVAIASRSLVIKIEHSSRNNHNGGDLHFGPDGMLYISTGDGGGGDDPDANGQTLIRAGTPDEQSTALLAKLLRIAPGPTGSYTIPADNPFAGSADARGEIYAYGLRNPFRFSFDRATGDLLIGDVGQDDAEEVNYSATRGRGANFGWSCFEGTEPNDGTDPPCTPLGHVPPVFTYDRPGCQAITGGYVVRDPGLATLAGRYLFGDYCDGVLRSIVPSTGAGDTPVGIDLADFSLASFGEDACGRIYVVQLSGAVSRLVDGQASPCPAPGTSPPPASPPPAPPPPPPAPPPAPGDPEAPYVRLKVTSPQRSAITRRVSLREILTNRTGRLKLSGRLRFGGRARDVWVRGTTLTATAGRPAKAALTMSAATGRLLGRFARRGRTEIDVRATIGPTTTTARVRVRAR